MRIPILEDEKMSEMESQRIRTPSFGETIGKQGAYWGEISNIHKIKYYKNVILHPRDN